jgi:mono/diheme cytochrome c family protein
MYKWVFASLLVCASVLGIAVLFDIASNQQHDKEKTAVAAKVPEGTLDATAAQALYKQNCISCHGVDLQGGVGPNLQKVGSKLTLEQTYKLLQNGKGMMPGFKTQLKDEEIANLSRWLAEKK